MTYPASKDTFRRVTVSPVSLLKVGDQNNMADTLEGVQDALGINPQGGFANVVARLNDIDTIIQIATSIFYKDVGGATNRQVALYYLTGFLNAGFNSAVGIGVSKQIRFVIPFGISDDDGIFVTYTWTATGGFTIRNNGSENASWGALALADL